MPLSTSNSNLRIPKIAFGSFWVSILIAFFILGTSIELATRYVGHTPRFQEDNNSWSLRREKIDNLTTTKNILLLGASRAQTDFDPATLQKNLPGYTVHMLGITGKQFAATLKDIAENTLFNGTVLITFNEEIFLANNQQQSWVDYYHRGFSHSGRYEKMVNRACKTWLQDRLVTTYPHITSFKNSLRFKKTILTARVSKPNGQSILNLKKQPQFFQDSILNRANKEYQEKKIVTIDKNLWKKSFTQYRAWVKKIQDRGGKVAFVIPPISGSRIDYIHTQYPRKEYVDLISSQIGAALIHYEDLPEAVHFKIIDNSHLDHPDACRYTKIIAKELVKRNLL